MYSLKELYKVGNGPSSSHTMAPKLAAIKVMNKFREANYFRVILQGSLALTGKGHLTDYIISQTFGSIKHDIIFDYMTLPPHPNTMIFIPMLNDLVLDNIKVFSIGGGSVRFDGELEEKSAQIYKLNSFDEIKDYCLKNGKRLYEYIYECEEEIKEHLEMVYGEMLKTIDKSLNSKGLIPGDLHIPRKAHALFNKVVAKEDTFSKARRLLCSYAYAVSEENASGGSIVTAPTCGASGVLPAVLKYAIDENKYSHEQIINALATAGIIGNLVKQNASISGAEAGCQAEVGTACMMGAAFYSELNDLSIEKIGTASEIALEHHLGLTCDPIKGYVQIPCIERNAVAAMRAIDAFMLANLLSDGESKISFDLVVKTMLETGKDISHEYRETSEGGLAKNYY